MSEKRDKTDKGQGSTRLAERTETRKPRLFKVLLHNDDYTTMEFVVEVLQVIFGKSNSEATQLMLYVHHKGRAIAGVYSNDVAQTKVHEATTAARAAGYPLLVTMEPE